MIGPVALWALINGALGGATWVAALLWKKPKSLTKSQICLRIFLGAMAAYIWFLAGLPDTLNYFLMGWFGPSAIDSYMEGYRIRNRRR